MIFAKAFIVVTVAVMVRSVNIETDNVIWGSKGKNDNLVHVDNVVKRGWLFPQSHELRFPKKTKMYNPTLSAIEVFDWGSKGAATVSLIQGGPGHRDAVIKFDSKWGSGLNFTVKYYTSETVRIRHLETQ